MSTSSVATSRRSAAARASFSVSIFVLGGALAACAGGAIGEAGAASPSGASDAATSTSGAPSAAPGTAPMPGAVGLVMPPFPTREEIRAAAALPAATKTTASAIAVPRWTITTPIPVDPIGVETAKDPWTELARDVAKAHGDDVALVPALGCAAHELAIFAAHFGSAPVETLSQFMLSRCGWPYAGTVPTLVTFTVPRAITTEAATKRVVEATRPDLLRALPTGPGKLGLAMARHEDKLVIAYLWSTPSLDLEPGYGVVTAGRVHVRGADRVGATSVSAAVNGDGYSATRCTNEAATAPQFAFSCPIPTSGSTWIEVASAPPGALVEHRALALLVHKGDAASLEWVEPAAPSTAPLTDASTIGDAILGPLNELRAATGARPLTIARAQSEVNSTLAPHAFAGLSDSATAADPIVLGAMAGWEVTGGFVQRASTVVTLTSATTAGEWLGANLAYPSGRLALLDPSREQLAIGAVTLPGTSIVASVTSTYALFHGVDHADVAAALATRVESERRALGRPKVKELVLRELERAARSIAERDVAPADALKTALEGAVATTGKSCGGVAVPTVDPLGSPLPPTMLSDAKRSYSVAVGHRRRKGAAWGEYVVMWIWTDG